ncbi:MAG: F0F1 ATP synthase subunit A [bacterium]|nr:MAG: F0F1 ATP synthase subunit A [bacterium]
MQKAGGLLTNAVEASPILHAGLATLLLIAVAWVVSRRYREDSTLPAEKTFSPSNIMEMAVRGLLLFMESIMGPEARRFVPLIGTTALFILFSNLLGSIPGFDSPTANINTTLACAIVVVAATHVIGVRAHGIKYIKHFMGPVWWLAWLIFPIELIGHIARVMSLSVRLFGNMFGDHTVVATFMMLVALGVPAIFMGFGVFVALIQTFVFTLLSIIYISGAIEEAH